MIWRYLEVVNAASDFETLKTAGEPFGAVLPQVTLRLPRGAFLLALVDWGLPFDGTFDEGRREILLWRQTPCLKLALTHEIGHLVYRYGLSQREQVGPWRTAVQNTRVFQYLEESQQTGWALALTDTGQQVEAVADEQELEYLLRWDELFCRAVAQYVAQVSGDEPMLLEIQDRSRPLLGTAFYPQHWTEGDFLEVQKELQALFAERAWGTNV